MKQQLTGLCVSGLVTLATAPLVRRWMMNSGVLDVPNHRSSHDRPIPRGGGIACAAGISAGLLASPSNLPKRTFIAILALASVGFADDALGGLDPKPRLIAQSLAGFTMGTSNSTTSAAVGAIIAPCVTNVINFMDGINGISAMTAAVWGIFSLPISPQAGTLGAVTAGSALGFLPYNAPSAQLFLGDAGSYLLGALVSAALITSLNSPPQAFRLAAPLLLYGADASQALIRRYRNRERLSTAHRDHIYQILVDETRMNHVQVSTLHAAAATLLGLFARANSRSLATLGTSAVLSSYLLAPWTYRKTKALTPPRDRNLNDAP